MLLFIIGLPGSGKSYWANKIRAALNFNAIDLDTEIEKRFQTSIPDLFEISEENFRIKEKEVLKNIIKNALLFNQPTVIASGGGTPCFYDNLARMKTCGKVIYLQSSIENIMKRMDHYPQIRPLLSKENEELKQQLIILEEKRKPFYEQAHLILDADNLTLPIFAQHLKSLLK